MKTMGQLFKSSNKNKNQIYSFAVSLGVVCAMMGGANCHAATSSDSDPESSSLGTTTLAVTTSTSSLNELLKVIRIDKLGHSQFYSESAYYSDYAFVTDSRLRYLRPIAENDFFKTEAYFGVSLQLQTLGANEKYYDNNTNPAVGLRTILYKKIGLILQAGYKNYIGEKYQGTRSVWDPKVVLAGEDFWAWDNPLLFSEGSFEFAYLPRLDSTPVTTLSVKQGLRFKPTSNINLDALGEINRLEARNPKAGLSNTEVRLGVRSAWESKTWNVAAVLFHAYNRIDPHGDVDGTLTVEGQF
jgi:hypothetical protein